MRRDLGLSIVKTVTIMQKDADVLVVLHALNLALEEIAMEQFLSGSRKWIVGVVVDNDLRELDGDPALGRIRQHRDALMIDVILRETDYADEAYLSARPPRGEERVVRPRRDVVFKRPGEIVRAVEQRLRPALIRLSDRCRAEGVVADEAGLQAEIDRLFRLTGHIVDTRFGDLKTHLRRA